MWVYCVVVQLPSHVQVHNPMDCSMLGFLVLHCLLEFAQTHVHWVNDAIQPSHRLVPSSPPALNLSQHQAGSFLMSWLFASGSQSIGALAVVLPVSIQGWFSLRLTGLISLLSKGLSRALSSITIWRHQYVYHSVFFMVQLSHPCVSTGKTIILTIWTFISKRMSLLFTVLSRFVIAFLLRSSHLLISWLQSPSTVVLQPKKRESVIASTFFHAICHEVMGPDAMILILVIPSFKLVLQLVFKLVFTLLYPHQEVL